MGKELAIKGHPTRGNEVIELFKMMGARHFVLGGTHDWYVINDLDNSITFHDHNYINCHEFVKFTLEEFLEKYPFKVGDSVIDIADGDTGIITAMKWDEDVSDMKYRVAFDNGDMGWYTNDTIDFSLNKDNKEMNGNIETNHSKVNGLKRGDEYPIMEGVECNECIKYYFPDGYEFVDTDDTGVYLKPIKPNYPKTYKECCDIVGIPPYYNLRYHTYEPNYDEYATSNNLRSLEDKLNILGKLLICRDAYWKIAGELIGLDESWEPNWHDSLNKFCIFRKNNIIMAE